MATPLQAFRSAITSRAIQVRDQLEQLKAEPARMKVAMHLIKPTVKDWPALGAGDSVEINAGATCTYLMVRLLNLDSMKDSRLMEVLGSFMGAYWETESAHDSEYYDGPARWYNFTGRFPTGHNDEWGYPTYHRPIYVSVLGVVKTDSPLCAKVKVRDEVVTTTRPVFEIVCTDPA